jgi:hypothetical protein
VRIPFGRQVDTVGGVRAAMIKLLHEARRQSSTSEP